MKYIYMAGFSGTRSFDDHNFEDMARICVRSLHGKTSGATLFVNWHAITDSLRQMFLDEYDGSVLFRDISAEDIALGFDIYKIAQLPHCGFVYGDSVIVLDLDTIVVGNVFDAFEYSFDVATTQRKEWLPAYPANIGFLAFRWGPGADKFVNNWIRECKNPSIAMFKRYVEGGQEVGRHCRDEDYMQVYIRYGQSFGFQFTLLPCEYNWFPLVDPPEDVSQACSEYLAASSSPSCRMLHFKGGNKSVMFDVAKAMSLWEA